ncbi:ExbD/TolR family protein [Marinimicrobium locisalis]|uniref:ExbD/TolR family protein n=1 Tax=Marinimicrobium locisalis TaxID=546022 RepID=UPI003221C682
MKQSMRARRMERHHRRLSKLPKLNLVSLMDIFTILVFFLLVNSAEVEVLSRDKNIELPASVADQQPDQSLLLVVGSDQIRVNGRPVASVNDVMAQDEAEIPGLAEELSFRAEQARPLTEAEEEVGRPITIMGDKDLHYQLLKKVMATCAATDYRDISLAVDRVASGGSE